MLSELGGQLESIETDCGIAGPKRECLVIARISHICAVPPESPGEDPASRKHRMCHRVPRNQSIPTYLGSKLVDDLLDGELFEIVCHHGSGRMAWAQSMVASLDLCGDVSLFKLQLLVPFGIR
jgi:hypothetical protein